MNSTGVVGALAAGLLVIAVPLGCGADGGEAGSGGSVGEAPGATSGPGGGGGAAPGVGGASTGNGGSGGATASAASTSASSSSAASTGSAMPQACAGGPNEIDMHAVNVVDNPPDLADWPVTTTLTEVDFTGDGVRANFSKKDGDGRWPDIVPPGWDGPLQYTMGLVECIDGQWYTSAVIEFWYGLDTYGGNVADDDQVAKNWYYDGRWGALAGRQPATGELVGVFVASGNLRNVTTDDDAQSPVRERSNVVLVPFPDVDGANHPF